MSWPISRGSVWYLERAGLADTRRGPGGRLAPGLNLARAVPVAPPLPRPVYLLPEQGEPPPDRGLSDVWPHGLDGESPQ
jgi:hypothetical protein